MVHLTMTPAAVAAIRKCESLPDVALEKLQLPGEPALSDPAPGNPISHGQLIELSKTLKRCVLDSDVASDQDEVIPYRLNDLLRGSKIYIPPPKPKAEPTPEYKALMARLRREEEARAYDRMLNPQFPSESFAQRFQGSPHANLFPSSYDLAKQEEDETTYADVNRQLTLILNVLISIICCSVCIWIAAKHWSTPTRLGLSISGSLVVAIAEVVIYSGYIRRLEEAKQKEKLKVEQKEVSETWVIEPNKDRNLKKPVPVPAPKINDTNVRQRKGKHG